MFLLIATVAVHAVRIYHEVELLPFPMKTVKQQQSILMMYIIITCPMSDLEHDRLYPVTEAV